MDLLTPARSAICATGAIGFISDGSEHGHHVQREVFGRPDRYCDRRGQQSRLPHLLTPSARSVEKSIQK